MGIDGFFDDYPRFFASSETGSMRNRLNRRHEGLISGHSEAIRGRRVLDLASHDGRWTLAALKAGAAHVTGIEARPRLNEAARQAMAEYDIAPDRFELLNGDVHEVLPRLAPGQFDTVFCLGFLYHTAHHMTLLSAIARLLPHDLIIDTDVCADDRPVVSLVEEDSSDEGHATAYDIRLAQNVLVGIPSRSGVELMLRHVGYGAIGYVDWDSVVADWTGLSTYRDGRRISLRASRDDSAGR